MQTSSLAEILKKRYDTAGSGNQVVSIYLFGIEFADVLAGKPLKEICAEAGISVAYATELAKARKLAPFVQLRK
jgi:hypothetical protein